jgi:serine phosphatase RsbU (regulator of sigma subunit)
MFSVISRAAALRMRSWIRSEALADAARCGDFAASIELGPSRRAVVVGDIAGHWTARGDAQALCGVVSALLERGVPPIAILRSASSAFSESFASEATPFASLFLAVADLESETLEYASAGHEPALLLRGEGAHDHDHLTPTGPLLGVEPGPAYCCGVRALVPGTVLVVVTDGITEARRDAGDRLSFFGSAGVARTARNAVRQTGDPARAIYDAALAHAGGSLSDDASVVVSAFAR